MDYFCQDCERKWSTKPPPRAAEMIPRTPPRGSYVQGISHSFSLDKAGVLQILPNEILLEILAIALTGPHNHLLEPVPFPTAPAVVRVCKWFNQLAIPFMYRDVRFEEFCGVVPPCRPARLFYRSLKENHTLGLLCNSFTVFVNDRLREKKFASYDLAYDLLTLLPNVKSFKYLCASSSEATFESWRLIYQAAEHMPLIEKLSLQNETYDGIFRPQLFHRINMPSLRTLTAVGLSEIADDEVAQGLPIGWEGSATFTSFKLKYFFGDDKALGSLLTWPKALEHFTFACEREEDESIIDWRISLFENILRPQRNTLRTLSITAASIQSDDRIDLASFPVLEKLTMGIEAGQWSPSIAAAMLLGPRLRVFVWDIYTPSYVNEWTSFGKREQDWILQFAQHAAEQSSALQTIRVNFDPRNKFYKVEDEFRGKSPWDLMEEIADATQLLGIELDYSPPRRDQKSKNGGAEFHAYQNTENRSHADPDSGEEHDV